MIWKYLLIALLLWWAWRYFRGIGMPRPAADRQARPAADQSARPQEQRAIDLIQCPRCDSFVAASGKRGCTRPDCPIG